MRETKTPHTHSVRPERSRGAPPTEPAYDSACPEPERSDRPLNLTFGPAGEVSNDRAEFDATREWLAHVEAGRIGYLPQSSATSLLP